MEPARRSELVQVEPANPARDDREALLHHRPVPRREVRQARQQLAQPPSAGDRRLESFGRVGTDLEVFPAREHHPEALDVVRGLARVEPVGAAGVVADHPAEGAPGMRRRVRAEGQAATLGRTAQVVEHHARLDLGGPALGVDVDDTGHVTAHVDDDGLVAGLPGQACARAARQQRSPRFRSHAGPRS